MATYIVEACGPKNENVKFGACSEGSRIEVFLRGRWDFGKVSHRNKLDDGKILSLRAPVIPGMSVVIDTEKKEARVVDILSSPEGRKVLAEVNAVFKEQGEGERKAHPTATYQLSQDDLKTWLKAVRQIVNNQMAVLLPGSDPLPEMDVIKAMPGKIFRDALNSGRQEERLSLWTSEVSGGTKATAGSK